MRHHAASTRCRLDARKFHRGRSDTMPEDDIRHLSKWTGPSRQFLRADATHSVRPLLVGHRRVTGCRPRSASLATSMIVAKTT